jgi:hypothetical protein
MAGGICAELAVFPIVFSVLRFFGQTASILVGSAAVFSPGLLGNQNGGFSAS